MLYVQRIVKIDANGIFYFDTFLTNNYILSFSCFGMMIFLLISLKNNKIDSYINCFKILLNVIYVYVTYLNRNLFVKKHIIVQ